MQLMLIFSWVCDKRKKFMYKRNNLVIEFINGNNAYKNWTKMMVIPWTLATPTLHWVRSFEPDLLQLVAGIGWLRILPCTVLATSWNSIHVSVIPSADMELLSILRLFIFSVFKRKAVIYNINKPCHVIIMIYKKYSQIETYRGGVGVLKRF